MSFVNEFPYSDFHELNADWLIKKTKDLLTRMKIIEEEMSKIEVMTKAEIEALIQKAIEDNNVVIFHALDTLHHDINDEMVAAIQQAVNNLTIYVDNQDSHYDTLAQSYAINALNQANAYTDDKVLNYTMMVSPVTGQYEDVRVVVNEIVSYFHTENALTAGEYDALDLTAQDYDDADLTAYNYDFNGKNLLP